MRHKSDNVDWMTSKRENIKRGKPCWKKRRKWVDEGTRAEKRGKISRNEENTLGPTLWADF